jgi:hypothetical protein
VVTLPKIGVGGKTVTFSGKILSVLPGNAEVGGLLATTVRIKPTSAAVVA